MTSQQVACVLIYALPLPAFSKKIVLAGSAGGGDHKAEPEDAKLECERKNSGRSGLNARNCHDPPPISTRVVTLGHESRAESVTVVCHACAGNLQMLARAWLPYSCTFACIPHRFEPVEVSILLPKGDADRSSTKRGVARTYDAGVANRSRGRLDRQLYLRISSQLVE